MGVAIVSVQMRSRWLVERMYRVVKSGFLGVCVASLRYWVWCFLLFLPQTDVHSQSELFTSFGESTNDDLSMASAGRDYDGDGCTEIYLGDELEGIVTMQSACNDFPSTFYPSMDSSPVYGSSELIGYGIGVEVISLRDEFSPDPAPNGTVEVAALFRFPVDNDIGKTAKDENLQHTARMSIGFDPDGRAWNLRSGHFDSDHSQKEFLAIARTHGNQAYVFVFSSQVTWSTSGRHVRLAEYGPFDLDHYSSWSGSTDYFKFNAEMIGDVNGDGISEIAIGDPKWGPNEEGRVMIMNGNTYHWAIPSLEQVGETITTLAPNTLFGSNIAVLAESSDPASRKHMAISVQNGGSEVVQIRDTVAPSYEKIRNIDFEGVGQKLAKVTQLGDVDGDGVPDFAINSRDTSQIRRGDFSEVPNYMILSEIDVEENEEDIGPWISGDFDNDGLSDDFASSRRLYVGFGHPSNLIHQTVGYRGVASQGFGTGECHSSQEAPRVEASFGIVGSGIDLRLFGLSAAFDSATSLQAFAYISPVGTTTDVLEENVVSIEGCNVYLGQSAPIIEAGSWPLILGANQDEKALHIDLDDSMGLVGARFALQLLLIDQSFGTAVTNPVLIEIAE